MRVPRGKNEASGSSNPTLTVQLARDEIEAIIELKRRKKEKWRKMVETRRDTYAKRERDKITLPAVPKPKS